MLKQQLCCLRLSVPVTWLLPVKRGCGVYSPADPTLFIWKPPELLMLICMSTQCSLPCPAILRASHSSLGCLFHIHLYFTAVQRLWKPYGQHCLCVPAWNLIPWCNSKMLLQEQMGIRGATQQVGCQTPCLSLISFVSVPLLLPPPRNGRNSRALLRTVLAKFCQEYRKFALIQPWH